MKQNMLPGFLFKVVLVASLVLAFLVAPHAVRAALTEPCGLAAPSASGYFFSNYESITYSPLGYLELHFRNQSRYSDGRGFQVSWTPVNDACVTQSQNGGSTSMGMPAGVTDWSVRFTSMSHFDLWDDTNNLLVVSVNILPTFPNYYRISLRGTIDGVGSFVNSRTFKIYQPGLPPEFPDTAEKSTTCPDITAAGYYFDSYEQAEYVDGLLRVHVRFKTPFNDGRTFRLSGIGATDPCSFIIPSYLANPDVRVTPRVRYYSFRMTSPTHWVMWDDENDVAFTCARCQGDIPSGSPHVLWYGTIDTNGSTMRTTPLPPTITTCCSSVLFLPGIMGSELYGGGEKLWEPTNESDVIGLELSALGKSINPNIVATNVIRTFDALANVDIYDEFIFDLAEASSTNKIDSYAAVPYDWRLSIPDILADGNIEATLRSLAANSYSDKVTIVAHSNGGLVAKALINALGAEAPDLIDQIVLVAVPQSGTPQAVAALLHGADASIPWSFSEARARAFAKNAPFAYHLLPHLDYYDSVGATIETPVITFAPGVSEQFTIPYGSTIDTTLELRNFINGVEGRSEPGYNELEYPSTGNASLFATTDSYMSAIGPNWQPPTGITVHQIAGVGEDTLAGITYKPSVRCAQWYVSVTSTPTCTRYENAIILSPNEVIDGDGTVVEPSALAMSASDTTKRWWMDLDEYQSDHLLELGPFAKTHKNILEVPELSSFILDNVITSVPLSSADYLSDTRISFTDTQRLKFTLHSPLTLSSLVPGVGVVREHEVSVPGASYKRYGEVQVIWVPKSLAPTLKLEGVDEGSFILEVEEYAGENKVNGAVFAGIPSTVGTIVTMEFPDGTIANAGDLQLDYNGDETSDVALAPVLGGTVTLPKLDLAVTAENKSMTLGNALPALTHSVTGLPSGITLTDTDITGFPECTTSATPTSPVGAYPITCTAGTLASDYYKFETFVAGTLMIAYVWSGFQQPIDDPVATSGISPSVFKAGSTVPVKFKLKNANGVVVEATILPQWLTPTRGAALSGSVDEPVYSDPATTGNTYRYDPTNQQYIYNWKTSKTDAGYWYRIYAKLNDGTIKSVVIGLR